ncbi:MAG: hypothetical protein MUE82_04080 [Chloroflexi bacterium]|jgi:hypothetical protein|nr:hypothetical protein [Chloroflexota bacterium]
MATPEVVPGCAAVREALEIAAVEPHGLEALSDARSPEDAAVVAHVAACPACAAEASRLREISALLRAGLAPAPSADLRGRTLAYVASVGRPRGPAAAPSAASPAPAAGVGAPGHGATAAAGPRRVGGARLALAGLAMAAVVVIAVAASALVATGVARTELAAERERSAQIARRTAIALRLLDDPAAVRIPMSGPGGVSGVAVISRDGYAGAHAGAVVSTSLPVAPAGSEYVCYVVIDGARRFVGRMSGDGTMHAWAGPMEDLADARPGSVGEYGVLLVPAGSGSVEGAPVMSGSLPGADRPERYGMGAGSGAS